MKEVEIKLACINLLWGRCDMPSEDVRGWLDDVVEAVFRFLKERKYEAWITVEQNGPMGDRTPAAGPPGGSARGDDSLDPGVSKAMIILPLP